MNELEHLLNYGEAQVGYTPNFDLLSQEEKEVLEPQLISAACVGFRRPETPEFAQDVSDHIRGGDLYIVKQEGVATGFAMMEQFPAEGVIYIAGVVKKPSAPSRIIEKIVEVHMEKTKFNTLTVRTQNDRVLEILANICKTVVALDRDARLDEADLLAKLGLIKPDSDMDLEHLIHKGYYGSPMIAGENRRRSSNSRVVNLTDRLDYNQGDAALGIGYK